MTVPKQQLQEWLSAKEDEHLEFKEAKANFDVSDRSPRVRTP
jgi:hypothetical protein